MSWWLGTSPESIDAAEDRELWNALCARLEIPQPAGGTAADLDAALAIAGRIGYPALVRPSYVLGGRAMEIVYDDEDLARAMAELAGFGSLGKEGGLSAERPVLVDRFLEDATEVDVDAIRDATGEVVIGGIMEHVEEAGVHSGDSACVIPPYSLSAETIQVLKDYTRRIAEALERDRAHQRAVRGEERPGLRDRGQPPRQPHRAVRGQGHRRAPRQGGQPGDDGRHPRRAARRGAAAPSRSRATTWR